MSSYGAIASIAPIAGSLLGGPVGGLAGSILGAGAGLLGQRSANKKAQQANEQRYQAILNLLRTQGAASKDEVRRSGEEERGAIAQSAIGRGLFNTSTLDTLNNMSLERQSRANTAIDESVTNRMAGVMESRTDAYPDPAPTQAAFASLGNLIGGKSDTAPNPGQQWMNDGGLWGALQKLLKQKHGIPGTNPAMAPSRAQFLNYRAA